MTRQFIQFTCEGDRLCGTIDGAASTIGLLIVSGGNEVRSGPFGSQAELARAIADRGYCVLRFDRRGIGDSEGDNYGFRASEPDIASAIAAFRTACPQMRRIVAFGNCDAASALLLAGGAGCDALAISNPWTFDENGHDDTPPAAIRSRYTQKLRNWSEWKRLLSGGVSIRKLAKGLRQAANSTDQTSQLTQEMQRAIAPFSGDVSIIISGRDRTGIAFKAAWQGKGHVTLKEGADHAFSSEADQLALQDFVASTLDEQARQLNMR